MKEEYKGIAILLVLIAISSVVILKVYNTIQELEKTYEYSKNGEIHTSKHCYTKNDVALCKENNIMVQVDSYYEVD